MKYRSLAWLLGIPLEICQAGGLIAYEIGTPDLGLASAGYAARAQDAATAMTNPAGMTRLFCTELMVGLQPLYGDLTFSPNSLTTVSGDNGGNALKWFPGGGAFFVYNLSSDFKLGLSSYGNFGLPLHYNGSWVGRYYATEASLLGMTLAPSLAYRIHDMWSLGLAIDVMYGIMNQKAAVNNSPSGVFGNVPDGELKYEDTTWGAGFTFGILFEPTIFTRFGITYTSAIDLKFKNDLEFTDTFPVIIPGGNVSVPLELDLTVPKQLMLSFYHDCFDWIAFLGNVGWQNWEQFGDVNIIVGQAHPTSFKTQLDFRDTWHAALGTQVTILSTWRLSLGTAYDSSMVANNKRSVSLPVGQAWRFGAGLEYFAREDFTVGVAYTRISGGNLSVNQNKGILTGHVAGEYANVSINYVGVNFDWIY